MSKYHPKRIVIDSLLIVAIFGLGAMLTCRHPVRYSAATFRSL